MRRIGDDQARITARQVLAAISKRRRPVRIVRCPATAIAPNHRIRPPCEAKMSTGFAIVENISGSRIDSSPRRQPLDNAKAGSFLLGLSLRETVAGLLA